ncbi:MAG TPA: 2-oxo-4-hydroxy-4-carboxy-5-ureidoimidazoline decarboxylase [Candidatus Limnocylindria bacterium]|jgi:2-oxo-4-hydroxy-4-carboxy--5-ureidoimidazoline (OHCU) decarboxylase|nr:2-oxo-4-hydroxy-4-carboxy-5-ureidoimidazoline decarboxylase [Candidatus Limnocylindria bacterium]
MPSDAMTRRLAAVFERAPGLAAALRDTDQDTPRSIIAKARGALERMTEPQRVAVLDAHPRIGADPASLSLDSRREQGDAADAATLRELAALNDAYEEKFGFRFVVFVAGRSKREVVPLLRARLANTREAELKAGLEEFLAISLDRLERAR